MFTDAQAIVDCELCIVGAGVAGLNALHSASCYLGQSDKVVLVDTRDAPGGMWCDTYDYVRLHQPHPMFTVGDIPWTLDRPPSHLADKWEVQHQLQHCLLQLRQRVDLHEYFGCRYLSHDEHPGDDGVNVDIRCQADGRSIRVRARRLIKAISYDITPSPALSLSSSNVRSLSPHDPELTGKAIAESKAPIVIVGGGKTAMDTAHYLIERHPCRDIRMVIGQGVMFANRDAGYPEGLRRWFGGSAVFEAFLDGALHFDGANAEDTMRYVHDKYALALNDRPKQFQIGLISTNEMRVIRRGVAEVIEDYLADVHDNADGPVMQLKGEGPRQVSPGTWFINCTGYLPSDEDLRYEPYISEGGGVLSINPTSLVFLLGSFSGYFLTHLFYRDRLQEVPLYPMDCNALGARRNKTCLGAAVLTQTTLNTLVVMQALPLKVMNDCRLDFNRWYPLPRRLPIQLRYILNNNKYQAHCRKALDRLGERLGIEMGVLPHVAQRQ